MKHYIEQRIFELEAELQSATAERKKVERKSDYAKARDIYNRIIEIGACINELRMIPVKNYPDTTGGEGSKYGKKKKTGVTSVGGLRATY